MSDSLMMIIGIFIAVVIMFIFPLMQFAQRTDELAQTTVHVAVSEFVDNVTTKGEITQLDYDKLVAKLASTGNTFDIQIEAQLIDDNSRRKTTTETNGELFGEYKYYSVYTTAIIDTINGEAGTYKLKKDDYVTVTVKNTNKTLATQLKNIFYRLSGKNTYEIGTTVSSAVQHGSLKTDTPDVAFAEIPQPEIEIPPEPEEQEKPVQDDDFVTITFVVDPALFQGYVNKIGSTIIPEKIMVYIRQTYDIMDEYNLVFVPTGKVLAQWKIKVPKNSKVRVYEQTPNQDYYHYGFEGDKEELNLCLVVAPQHWVNLTYNKNNDPGTLNAQYIVQQYAAHEWIADADSILLLTFESHYGKPIIYLYPEEETEINVKVADPEKLTVSYPKYSEQGWNVIAKPDGTLKDTQTGRELYSLYYEANTNIDKNMYKDGFIVKGEDMQSFLEEKLAILGLNERETEEFIIYWLPKLEKNKYTFIRFAESEYINSAMPLEITPTPDNVIRVLMEFKSIDKPFEIKEQKLTTPLREGYTVVEWGATEIN